MTKVWHFINLIFHLDFTSLIFSTAEPYDLAVKFGALFFVVEHRFYGKSLNPDGLELHNLQYLSSQQA